MTGCLITLLFSKMRSEMKRILSVVLLGICVALNVLGGDGLMERDTVCVGGCEVAINLPEQTFMRRWHYEEGGGKQYFCIVDTAIVQLFRGSMMVTPFIKVTMGNKVMEGKSVMGSGNDRYEEYRGYEVREGKKYYFREIDFQDFSIYYMNVPESRKELYDDMMNNVEVFRVKR